MENNTIKIDSLVPQEMAQRAEEIGMSKVKGANDTTFVLSIMAGSFIALGAVFATTVATGSAALPFGVSRLFTGLAFCLGLILVVIGGAELFTGNNLIVMAWAGGKVSTRQLLRNWAIVYIGNFVGSLSLAVLIVLSKHYTFSNGAVGQTAINIAISKVHLDFVQAVALGILCNVLVCLAVWLTLSARTTLDKIAAIIFPITAFVAAGFEHSVANMYFIPVALFIKQFDPSFVAAMDLGSLNWGNFLLNNLLPVTIGNIIGGAILVAAVYWAVYLRRRQA
jgi:formate transporter